MHNGKRRSLPCASRGLTTKGQGCMKPELTPPLSRGITRGRQDPVLPEAFDTRIPSTCLLKSSDCHLVTDEAVMQKLGGRGVFQRKAVVLQSNELESKRLVLFPRRRGKSKGTWERGRRDSTGGSTPRSVLPQPRENGGTGPACQPQPLKTTFLDRAPKISKAAQVASKIVMKDDILSDSVRNFIGQVSVVSGDFVSMSLSAQCTLQELNATAGSGSKVGRSRACGRQLKEPNGSPQQYVYGPHSAARQWLPREAVPRAQL